MKICHRLIYLGRNMSYNRLADNSSLNYGWIYCITNNINGKIYIGQTIDFKQRVKDYYKSYKYKNQKLRPIISALKKYKFENFTFETIGMFPIIYLDFYEIMFIKLFKSLIDNDNGYNIEVGGNANKTLSHETKEKISNALKGKAGPNKGIKTGKIPWNKGVKMPKEHSERMSILLKSLNLKSPMKGKTHSLETRNKLSNSLKGRAAWNKGQKIREDLRLKLIGKSPSNETKEKMKNAKLGKVPKHMNNNKIWQNKKNLANYKFELSPDEKNEIKNCYLNNNIQYRAVARLYDISIKFFHEVLSGNKRSRKICIKKPTEISLKEIIELKKIHSKNEIIQKLNLEIPNITD